jgi:hypothetical protein
MFKKPHETPKGYVQFVHTPFPQITLSRITLSVLLPFWIPAFAGKTNGRQFGIGKHKKARNFSQAFS